MDRLCYEYILSNDNDPIYIPVSFIQNMNMFRSAVDILYGMKKNTDRIRYVEAAYLDFLNQKQALRKYTNKDQIDLERKARSFFVEFSIYLARWEKYIKHHPRKNEFEKYYKHRTHDAYDSSDDYAIATIIRNYVSHSSDIIQGTIWGNTYYDVGFFKYALLKDDNINISKKEIINRQPGGFVLLAPIMKGALEKLEEVHKSLITFAVDDEIRKAAVMVSESIQKIKEYDDKEWFFINDDGQTFSTIDYEGKIIEYIQGKLLEGFHWKEFDEVIQIILR